MYLRTKFLVAVLAVSAAQGQAIRFHHLHLNSTDPSAAIDFYTTKFQAEKRSFAGEEAVWTGGSWLLLTNVPSAPKADITSGIWHMGWGGGADMRETYRKQIESGTLFATPLTDISDQCDGRGGNGRFLFAYVDGPDHALIELNTTAAGNQGFGHVHLLSEDPIAAGEWYVKHLGLAYRGSGPPSPETRFRCGRQTGPAVSLMAGHVNVIIYPVGNAKAAFPEAWKGRTGIESSEGHTIDHLAFAVDDLDQTLARLRDSGVRVGPVRTGTMRSAYIEGPDQVRIELFVEPRP